MLAQQIGNRRVSWKGPFQESGDSSVLGNVIKGDFILDTKKHRPCHEGETYTMEIGYIFRDGKLEEAYAKAFLCE
jgi:hypothetical protein